MSEKKITGYYKSTEPMRIDNSPALVGCKRCNKTWYEERPSVSFRKNSADMCYDYCSDCKTEDEL